MLTLSETALARRRREYEGQISTLSPECFGKMANWFAALAGGSAVDDPAAAAYRSHARIAEGAADPEDHRIAAPNAAVGETGHPGDLVAAQDAAAVFTEDLVDRPFLWGEPGGGLEPEGARVEVGGIDRHRNGPVHAPQRTHR